MQGVEVVDEHVYVRNDDAAVLTFEPEEFAVLCGLDAIDEDKFAAAFLVVDIFNFFLCMESECQEQDWD